METIHHLQHQCVFATAPTLIAPQYRAGCRIPVLRKGARYHLSKRRGIGKALVCPKARKRVHRVSGVPHKRNPIANVVSRMAANEGKSRPGTDFLNVAQAVLKCVGKLQGKGMVIECEQFFCPIGVGRPNNRAFVVRER